MNRLALAVALALAPIVSNPSPAQAPSPTPHDAFARFFSGPLAHKTILIWGNSTTAFETGVFETLAAHTGPGDVLAGIATTPEVDNPDHADPPTITRNQNGHVHALGNIINMGNNGATLKSMLAATGGPAYKIEAVCAAAPELLIVRGPLINDVRQGACDLTCAKTLLHTMLDRLHTCLPQTDILLQVENSLLTADPKPHGYVKPDTPEAAQAYSSILRDAGLSFQGAYPHVYVQDLQQDLYGITSPATSPLMGDQLHPNHLGQVKEGELIVDLLRHARPTP
jgi:hypothetical protein